MKDSELVKVSIDFDKQYSIAAEEIAASILLGRIIDRTLLANKITEKMVPIIDDMFVNGITATNKVVEANIAKLVIDYDMPYKWNKDLLLNLNDKSIFAGYYDKSYKDLFSTSEINKLKNVILSAKYGGWDESKTITAIKNVTNMTSKRALLLARNEDARLTSVANQLYFEKKEVRDSYDLVWFNSGDNIRPSHKAMAGKKANEDGMFESDECGLVPGPPLSCSPYNCKCYSSFVLKD